MSYSSLTGSLARGTSYTAVSKCAKISEEKQTQLMLQNYAFCLQQSVSDKHD
jgi:hypothetical protein